MYNNFNDHLNFFPNIHDNFKHRKNLNEAGLKKALKFGKKKQLEQELIRQIARKESHQEEAGKKNIQGKALEAETHSEQARDIMQNIEDIAQQLDFEHPEGSPRVKISDITPTQY